MVWRIFKQESWRIRSAGMGAVVGVDLADARAMLAAGGMDSEIAAELLAGCEKGFVLAMNERDDASEN